MAKADCEVRVTFREFEIPTSFPPCESAAVLADELELVEKELFDVRGFYLEEVRLCKELTDENLLLWSIRTNLRLDKKHLAERNEELRDELFAAQTKAKKRDRWVGVALAVAFALGGYVGFAMGCAQ